MKSNCWEHKKCGREPGGFKANQLGVCPASLEKKVDKINNGKNGGRSCWAVAGTLCGGVVQGTFSMKLENCINCDFYQLVYKEEKGSVNYKTTREIIQVLNKKLP
ncbi:MAG: hypothetical protein A2W99_11870 [Bacteroidetes bacterium GWF2_33_16]|nr:MAG: hypothetical protein A2X00_02405 [Bacteroidetes bacterium GWE2_32_14]OFY06396.1 MAG: hypothetical protein A2W99_11870 [Bacteroidetes bacterium GWF2_33_16]